MIYKVDESYEECNIWFWNLIYVVLFETQAYREYEKQLNDISTKIIKADDLKFDVVCQRIDHMCTLLYTFPAMCEEGKFASPRDHFFHSYGKRRSHNRSQKTMFRALGRTYEDISRALQRDWKWISCKEFWAEANNCMIKKKTQRKRKMWRTLHKDDERNDKKS